MNIYHSIPSSGKHSFLFCLGVMATPALFLYLPLSSFVQLKMNEASALLLLFIPAPFWKCQKLLSSIEAPVQGIIAFSDTFSLSALYSHSSVFFPLCLTHTHTKTLITLFSCPNHCTHTHFSSSDPVLNWFCLTQMLVIIGLYSSSSLLSVSHHLHHCVKWSC